MPRTNLSSQFTSQEIKEHKAHIVARNTFKRVEADGTTVIRLHATDIVRIAPNGSVTLESGGYRTVTTKERMNRYLPGGVRIYQNQGLWYISKGGWEDRGVPYFDGIVVPDCFDDATSQATGAALAKEQAAMRKRVLKYVKGIDKLAKLPWPDAGDCWLCSMFEANNMDSGNDHLLSHMEEGYIHGTLLWNAMKWRGRRSPGYLLQGNLRDLIKNDLRHYLYHRLGI